LLGIGSEPPSWIFLVNALFMFIYQTMDAIDGKQARRTASSSPLGELFDHGCDAATTVLSTLTGGIVFQLSPQFTFYSLLTSLIPFFLAQWEEYYTGVLELGVIGVTEAQLMYIVANLMCYFQGPRFWLQTFSFGGLTLRYNEAIFWFLVVSAAYLSIMNLIGLIRCQTKSGKSILSPFAQLVPILIATVCSLLWIRNSPSLLLKHPHEFMLAVGFTFVNMVGQMVLARVCKQQFSPVQLIVLPVFLGWLNSVSKWSLFNEEYFLYAFVVVAIGAYVHFALSVIGSICKALNIKCLHITYKKEDKK
jgi:ethanolaminephosphotransferase